MSTQNVGEVLHRRQATIVRTIGDKETNTIVKQLNNCKGYQCTPQQVDMLVDDATNAGLTNLHNNGTDMRPWYCKAAYVLGSEIFYRCMAQAREGRNPKALFSYLLTLELKKAGQRKSQPAQQAR